ncbi:hypothetical protein Syun_002308 [Stephania yunnanensis]|uniref:POTRA domain-containing protein n=1 Tax=Stephania yunnanensis TaxID=152371 RepID=A0AAP0Q7X2_9MAGN
MEPNRDIRFISSSIKLPSSPPRIDRPLVFSNLPFCSQTLSSIARFVSSIEAIAKSRRRRRCSETKLPLLCSASLALAEGSQSKGFSQIVRSRREDEERVLISEVLIRNKDGEELERKDLEAEAAAALKACRPNSALTVREVQEDVHRIMERGYFCSCMPVAVDTRDGIRLVFQVDGMYRSVYFDSIKRVPVIGLQRPTVSCVNCRGLVGGREKVEPNQEFQGLVCEGANVLPSKFLEDAFRDGYGSSHLVENMLSSYAGKVVNVRRLNDVIQSIDGWYRERGLFGLVSDLEILSGGVIRLQVSEAEVNNITIRFLDRKTGEPTTGKTRPETILRQLTTKKGQVYSLLQGRRDVETLLAMGIMEDVSIIPQPAGDTGKVDLLLNIVERVSGGFSAGGGISSGITSGPLSGLVGSFAYSHRNVFGRNQKLNMSWERGQVDSIFRINYTDPWIEGDDKRTSRSIMVQNSNLTIGRVTAGIEFSRPLTPKWSGTTGVIYQRAGARDEQGNPIIKDFFSSPLTASGNTHDEVLLAKLEAVYTDSGDSGSSMLVLNMEQGLPVLPEWLSFTRGNARTRKGLEIGHFRFLFRHVYHLYIILYLVSSIVYTLLSGGHVVGNFPPHEAFAIGGTNSVRGYEEGAVGSGRSYVVGSGEISFPMFGPVDGVLFADYGSDLGSGPTVPGDPAGARLKPGSGYGYGVGIRVDSPLGPLRLEYAFNDRQARRFHFGVGHRN